MIGSKISGIYLHRTCHLNASVIIKGIPGITLEFILLRYVLNAERGFCLELSLKNNFL